MSLRAPERHSWHGSQAVSLSLSFSRTRTRTACAHMLLDAPHPRHRSWKLSPSHRASHRPAVRCDGCAIQCAKWSLRHDCRHQSRAQIDRPSQPALQAIDHVQAIASLFIVETLTQRSHTTEQKLVRAPSNSNNTAAAVDGGRAMMAVRWMGWNGLWRNQIRCTPARNRQCTAQYKPQPTKLARSSCHLVRGSDLHRSRGGGLVGGWSISGAWMAAFVVKRHRRLLLLSSIIASDVFEQPTHTHTSRATSTRSRKTPDSRSREYRASIRAHRERVGCDRMRAMQCDPGEEQWYCQSA